MLETQKLTQKRFLKFLFSDQTLHFFSFFVHRATAKEKTCLDRFDEVFINNTSHHAASCREELENQRWNISLPESADCIYWCDAKDYPKSIFNIRTRQKGAFAFYRGYFQQDLSDVLYEFDYSRDLYITVFT